PALPDYAPLDCLARVTGRNPVKSLTGQRILYHLVGHHAVVPGVCRADLEVHALGDDLVVVVKPL
ncbi:hypothetical protein QN402_32330, partial [Pseudomonas sp. FG1]|nr:hypothetical protein [Pseudomonas sp. FG1]